MGNGNTDPVSKTEEPHAVLGENFSVLVSHADRYWKAEEVNATRIANRANLVLSGITAVIGLKFVAIGKEIDTILAAANWQRVFFAAASMWAAFLLGWSWLRVLGIGSKKTTSNTLASDDLAVEAAIQKDPTVIQDADIPVYIFKQTYNAAVGLKERNLQRQLTVDGAQRLFAWALLSMAVSIVIFVLAYANRPTENSVSSSDGGVHGEGGAHEGSHRHRTIEHFHSDCRAKGDCSSQAPDAGNLRKD
ncbi:MAG: hypothetical protein AMXMBFR58_15290 [Phycisphaerae bacterium]